MSPPPGFRLVTRRKELPQRPEEPESLRKPSPVAIGTRDLMEQTYLDKVIQIFFRRRHDQRRVAFDVSVQLLVDRGFHIAMTQVAVDHTPRQQVQLEVFEAREKFRQPCPAVAGH